MTRRAIVLVRLALGLLPAPAARPEESKAPARDWVVYYYTAYDDALSPWGPKILDMLASGITADGVAVACSSDLAGPGGMKRYVLTKGRRQETAVA